MPRPPRRHLAELVTAAGQRWMVEEAFQAAKSQGGLDEHEVRKWYWWYRHTTACMLAMAFLTAVRSRHIPTQPAPLAPNRERDLPPVDRIVLAPARNTRTWLVLHWRRWRTRHQTRARASHYRTRTARAHSP